MDAGISIHQDSIDAFEAFKMKSSHEFVVYRMNDKMTSVEPETCSPPGQSQKAWDEYKDTTTVTREPNEPVEYWNMRRMFLDSKQPRFGTIMVPMKTASHPVLICWSPPNVDTKLTMVYSTTKNKFKGRLTGLKATLQCNDLEELSYSDVAEICKKI